MKCIADVSVLLPLVCGGHLAETSAYHWFDRKEPQTIGWCLPIRLAILRHLSSKHIMGAALQAPESALNIWATLQADERLFEIESIPPTSEHFLRINVRDRTPSPKLWTNAWLAAVAEASGMEMVTFDNDFKHFSLSALTLLKVSPIER